jgi:hypothetical protein
VLEYAWSYTPEGGDYMFVVEVAKLVWPTAIRCSMAVFLGWLSYQAAFHGYGAWVVLPPFVLAVLLLILEFRPQARNRLAEHAMRLLGW